MTIPKIDKKNKIHVGMAVIITIVCSTLISIHKRLFFEEPIIAQEYHRIAEAPLSPQSFLSQHGFGLFIGCALILTAIIYKMCGRTPQREQRKSKR